MILAGRTDGPSRQLRFGEMFSPLIFMGGFYAVSLVIMAVLDWLVWELCVMMYPERFWDKSNAALKCANCTDKLCTQYCQKLRK